MADDGSSAAGSVRSHGADTATGTANRSLAALGEQIISQDAAGAPIMTSLSEKIAEMKKVQLRMREERKRAAKELKNAQRKKRRLKSRARQLSNDDLLAVLMLRQEQAEDGGDDVVAPSPSASSSAAPAAPLTGGP